MGLRAGFITFSAALLLPVACAFGPVMDSSRLVDMINLELVASGRLNQINGRPHSMLVTVLQLQDPAVITRSVDNYQELVNLMEVKYVDDKVLHASEVFIRPAERLQLRIKREQEAAYLAVIAGYYQPRRTRDMTFLMSLKVDKQWLVLHSAEAKYMTAVKLILGTQSMKGSGLTG